MSPPLLMAGRFLMPVLILLVLGSGGAAQDACDICEDVCMLEDVERRAET